ncbi:hypothetical protein [Luteitalea sp.]
MRILIFPAVRAPERPGLHLTPGAVPPVIAFEVRSFDTARA